MVKGDPILDFSKIYFCWAVAMNEFISNSINSRNEAVG
jgi:hypothetical protein